MLVNDLMRLLESGEYKACLERAASLLERDDLDLEGHARVQEAICRSRLRLTDYFGAIAAGQEAIRLAQATGLFDLLGFALIDVATAQSRIRRPEEALATFERFLASLPSFTAARCMEGTVLQRMADVLKELSRQDEALQTLNVAMAWSVRFGDEHSVHDCRRAAVAIHIERLNFGTAQQLLEDGDRFVQQHPHDRELLAAHLLDWAGFYFGAGRPEDCVQAAFQALEMAGDSLEHQSRAQLLLAYSALSLGQPEDALNFAMGARVGAIDRRLYQLEFEASDIIFQVLRSEGVGLIRRLDAQYYHEGVDLYHYLSARVIRRMESEH